MITGTAPTGRTLYLDGISKVAPFVYETLVGFNHTIEARNQSVAATKYNFASWSDGDAQQHTIVVPASDLSYTATYNVSTPPATPAFVQVNSATPQSNQRTVTLAYAGPQTAGNTNAIAVGWNDAISTITSVTDAAGNIYQVVAPIARGTGLSQAIYYAKAVKAAPAGNTVTVRFSGAVPFADVRVTEYSGVDALNPLDATASASGSGTTANSGNFATTVASELVFRRGMTTGAFTGDASGFTTCVITPIDAEIVADRTVTSVGTYSAGVVQGGAAQWVMQGATVRAAGQ